MSPPTIIPRPILSSTRRWWLALLAVTLAGAALRLVYAWERPRLGDEIGTLLNLRLGAGYLLTHFSGWLTMNYFILAEKGVAMLSGSEGWPLEVLPMLGGVATIPLTAALARRLGNERLALVAAVLAAFNPFLVRFSPVLRSYSLLGAFSLGAVTLFYRWRASRDWKNGSLTAAGVFLLLLSHPNGIYVVAGLGVLATVDLVAGLRRAAPPDRKIVLGQTATLLAPLAVAGPAVFLAYRGVLPDVRIFNREWSAPAPTGLEYIPGVLATYFGEGFVAFIPAGLLLAGVWSATQNSKKLLPLCLLAALSPVLISLKGVSHFPSAYARFQIYCIPFLLILMAEGILWLAARISSRTNRCNATAATLAAVALLGTIPAFAELFGLKREDAAYAQAAAYLHTQNAPGDTVVIAGGAHLAMTPLLPQGSGAPVRAEAFVKKQAEFAGVSRVLFVAPSDPPLGAPEKRRQFGKLQIVDYAGSAAEICRNLREDLARAADRRVQPSLAETYRLLALLDRGGGGAGKNPAVREWRLLAQLCRARSKRYLALPEQKRERENNPGSAEGTGQPGAADAPPVEETTGEN